METRKAPPAVIRFLQVLADTGDDPAQHGLDLDGAARMVNAWHAASRAFPLNVITLQKSISEQPADAWSLFHVIITKSGITKADLDSGIGAAIEWTGDNIGEAVSWLLLALSEHRRKFPS